MRWLIVLVLCGWSGVALANKPVVAVFEIKNEAGLKKGFVQSLHEVVAAELTASNKYSVVPNSDIQKAIREKQAESYASCYDESCQIEIGKEIAAEMTLATSIKKLGSKCVITMQLYNLRTGSSGKAATSRSGCTEDFVLDSIYRVVTQLTGKSSSPQSAAQADEVIGDKETKWSPSSGEQKVIVKFESKPQGAVVMLDGKLLCASTPCRKTVVAGFHQVSMQKERYSEVTKSMFLKRSSHPVF